LHIKAASAKSGPIANIRKAAPAKADDDLYIAWHPLVRQECDELFYTRFSQAPRFRAQSEAQAARQDKSRHSGTDDGAGKPW
jgi:hypothetical protein